MAEAVRGPLADYHRSKGATLAEYHGAVVPARYSDPVAEHRAVRKASGILDFSFRAKLAMRGEDRVRFLNGMVTNEVKDLPPGQGTYALLLNVQGQILADLKIYAARDQFLIDVDYDLLEKIQQSFDRYIIADQVELEPVELAAVSFQGPRARPLLEKTLHIDLPQMRPFDHFDSNYAGFPVRVVRNQTSGEEGYEVWISPKGLLGLWGGACGQAPTYGTLPVGSEAMETLRIEAGIPTYGDDLYEDTLALEAGLLDALSFTKGCYLGQEIVERARSRGRVNWSLAGLLIDGPQPPAAGEKLVQGEKEVGEITSACVSPTLSRTIALGYLRREVAEPGTRLALKDPTTSLEVTKLPFYSSATSSDG